MHVRVVGGHRLGHLLEQGGLSRFGRGNDHAALSLSDGGQKVQHPHGHGNALAWAFHMQPLVGENGGQVLKIRAGLRGAQRIPVHGADVEQGREFLRGRLHPAVSADNVAGFQVETADLGRRHIHVVISGQEIFAADKAKSVGHYLQDTVGLDAAVQLRQVLIV